MPKIKVHYSLQENGKVLIKKDQIGLIHDNRIQYKEKNRKVTILINENTIEMIRETAEYRIHFMFSLENKTQVDLHVFDLKQSLSLPIYTKVLDIQSNEINIIYDMIVNQEAKEYQFIIKYEVLL